jgi:hypothetical protein
MNKTSMNKRITCNKCGESKDENQFYQHRLECKTCRKARNAQYYKSKADVWKKEYNKKGRSNCVYKLVDTKTNKILLVGSTSLGIESRFKKYQEAFNKSENEKNKPFYKFWRKIGLDRVEITLVKEYKGLDRDELYAMEDIQKKINKPVY